MALAMMLLSRLFNGARLLGRPGHRRRVRASRRALRHLRRWGKSAEAGRVYGYLRAMDPLLFEELVLTALEQGGRLVLRNTRYTGDGGIDGKVYIGGCGWVALQAKRYCRHVDHRDVQALVLLVERGAVAGGLFVHTGRTGAAAYRDLGGTRVQLLSGDRLLDLLLTGKLAHGFLGRMNP